MITRNILRDLGPLLWAVRITLLVAVLLHIYFTVSLALDNRRARPHGYKKKGLHQGELRFTPHGRERPGCACVYCFPSSPFYRSKVRRSFSDAEK